MNPIEFFAHAGLAASLSYTATAKVIVMPLPQCHVTHALPMEGLSAANSSETLWADRPRPDHLLEARYVSPSQIFLRFADGLAGSWAFDDLELDMSGMKVTTIAAAGTAVTVQSKWNDDVAIDASALRASVDPAYRDELEKSFLALRGPLDKF